MAERKKLLSLNFFPNFSPPRTGGEQRSFFLLKALSRTFDIVSVSPSYEEGRLEILEITPGFTEVRVPKSRAYRSVSAAIRSQKSNIHQTAMAYAIASPSHSEMVDYICDVWDSIDGVILQHATCAALLDALNLPEKKVFYLSHNCEFELAVNAHRQTHAHTYSMAMHQFEHRACQHASVVVACTDLDGDKFRHLFGVDSNNIHIAGNGSVDRFGAGYLGNCPAPDHASAIFLGSKWGPNRNAANYILTNLAPENPDVVFHIVGNVCDVLSVESLPANVQLHGEVSEEALAALMRKTHIGLNPIIDGAGSNVKLADYLAHGLRVITSEKGARGFVHDLENLTIVPDQSLSRALKEAVSKPPVSGSDRERWREAAAFLWSWDSIGTTLAERLMAEFEGRVTLKRDKRILVMNEFPVRGRDSGGEARIAGLLSNPDPDMLVTIVSFGRGDFDLHQLHPQVACIELPAIQEQKDAVRDMNQYAYTSADDVVFPVTSSRNGNFLLAVETMVSHADSVVLEHPFMWPVYKQVRSRAPVVFGSHNVEAEMKRVTLDSHKRKYELCDQIKEWEMELTQHAQVVCACSTGDAEIYKTWGAKAVYVLENGVTPLEDQLGEIDREEDRSIYLRSEFNLDPDQAAIVLPMLLKREATAEEEHYITQVLAESGTAIDAFLASVVRSQENLNGPKTYVTGLDRTVDGARFSTVFLGTSHRPNLSAAELIVGHFAPQCPNVDFVIMGKVGRSLASRELPDNVFLTGFVSNAVKTAAMRDIDAGLNPMTEGGGSNLKIPDYLVHDLDVVSTPFGARGFEVDESGGLFQAEIVDFVPVLQRLVSESLTGGAVRDRSALKRYFWSELSSRYFSIISEHTRLRAERPVLLVEKAGYLEEKSLLPEATYLPELVERNDAEVFVRAPVLEFGAVEPVEHSTTFRRLRYIEEPREIQFTMNGLPSFGAVAPRLVSIPMLEYSQSGAQADEFSSGTAWLGSGFTAPLYNGRKVHRFMSKRAEIALPPDTSEIDVSGYAIEPSSIRVLADGVLILSQVVHKKFALKSEVDGARTLVFETVAQSKVARQASLIASLEEFSFVASGLRRRLSLLGSAPGAARLLENRPVVDGLAGRAERPFIGFGSLFKRMRRTATPERPALVIGAGAFCQAFQELAEGGRAERMYALCDNRLSNLNDLDSGIDVPMALEDWLIGLVANERNCTGYLNKRSIGPNPLVVVADAASSGVIAMIERVAARLSQRFPQTKVVLFLPEEVMRSAGGAAVADYFEGLKKKLTILSADSEREMIAVMAQAGLTVAHGAPASLSQRFELLRRAFEMNIVEWGGLASTQVSGNELPKVHTIDHIINSYWRYTLAPPNQRSGDLSGASLTVERDAVLAQLWQSMPEASLTAPIANQGGVGA